MIVSPNYRYNNSISSQLKIFYPSYIFRKKGGSMLMNDNVYRLAFYNINNPTLDGEVWKLITSASIPDVIPESYYVSNYCRILNANTFNILRPHETNNGYLRTFLYTKDHKRGLYYLNHRIGMKEFKPLDDYTHMQVNHKDGEKHNNDIDNNLEWITGSENVKHAYDTGLKTKERTNSRENRLSIQEADEIGKLLSSTDMTHREIAEKIGCSMCQVQCISAGVNYNSVYKKYNLESRKRKYEG